MIDEVDPLRIESAEVDQKDGAVEAASVNSVSSISVGFDRKPSEVEKSAIRHYFDTIGKDSQALSAPSFPGKRLEFTTVDPNAAIAVVDYLRSQAKNLAERTESRRAQAAEMLRKLEKELQPPREKGDFRPVEK